MADMFSKWLTSRQMAFTIRDAIPSVHYNKVFKLESLPARIRYNHFFVLTLIGGFCLMNNGKLVSYPKSHNRSICNLVWLHRHQRERSRTEKVLHNARPADKPNHQHDAELCHGLSCEQADFHSLSSST